MPVKLTLLMVAGLVLAGCADSEAPPAEPGTDPNREIREAFLAARPGQTITIPAGIYRFTRSLSIRMDGVTIRGAGMDESILSFSGQRSGAEGLLVRANDFTISDLAIEDTAGDALKISEGRNIVIRRVRTEWTNGPDTRNGAYGIYPVQTENTLIEGAVAIGASDAGIYVGQSRNVIIRDSLAEFNVAGIEIENTIDADVYNNLTRHNTAGILVFNMPNLPQEGKRTRIFDNRVLDNNTANFARPGGAVASVPAGSGIAINSHDLVEIFGNELSNNQTAHILISSLYSTNYSDREAVSDFDPFPERIYIHENRYEGGGNQPDTDFLPAIKNAAFGENGRFPNVIWDGFANPEKMVDGRLPPELRICIDREESADVFNIDAPNRFAAPRLESEEHRCRHARLAEVELAASLE